MSDVIDNGMNMNDDEFRGMWSTLQPAMRQRRKIDGRVFEWLDARETSLAAEWLGLFRVERFSAVGLVTVSAVSIAFSIATGTPLLLLARALL